MTSRTSEHVPPYRAIDLFCGCGGFSLGLQRAGFQIAAAIDFNPQAIATFRSNLSDVAQILERDLTQFGPEQLAAMIGHDPIDLIVGGPPCQGFSLARQRDGANHGQRRLIVDPRRHLYLEFLRYVGHFKPKVFVMENVLGIRSAAGGEYFTRVQREARQLGYRVHSQIEDAWELGVPQKRRRQLIIGTRDDLPGYFPTDLPAAPRAVPGTTLGAAIRDLPVLRAGAGAHQSQYNLKRRERSLRVGGAPAQNYLLKVLEIKKATELVNHVARPHNARDLRDFALLKEGETSATAMRVRGVRFEFPYDKTSFKDRYTRQNRSSACSTIVAHLSKDGLMFIHPTQNRSLTPREAARVQSFPDWFVFPTARTHAFRIIGNAVPPLISESVGIVVTQFLKAHNRSISKVPSRQKTAAKPIAGITLTAKSLVPDTLSEAENELRQVVLLDHRGLRALPPRDFVRAWYALIFLMPGLHPDNALDHGDTAIRCEGLAEMFATLGPENHLQFERSGWPVAFKQFGREAWRRYDRGELADEDFYCVAAQRAAMGFETESDMSLA